LERNHPGLRLDILQERELDLDGVFPIVSRLVDPEGGAVESVDQNLVDFGRPERCRPGAAGKGEPPLAMVVDTEDKDGGERGLLGDPPVRAGSDRPRIDESGMGNDDRAESPCVGPVVAREPPRPADPVVEAGLHLLRQCRPVGRIEGPRDCRKPRRPHGTTLRPIP